MYEPEKNSTIPRRSRPKIDSESLEVRVLGDADLRNPKQGPRASYFY
jgi:hypothetical protein